MLGPTKCGSLGCGFLSMVLAIEDEARAQGAAEEAKWWASRWVAAHKSDGSGRQATADMSNRTNEVYGGREIPPMASPMAEALAALKDAEAAIGKYAEIGRRVGGTGIDPDERPGVATYASRLSEELAKVWLEWDDKRRARKR
jgi:hypothetical protein